MRVQMISMATEAPMYETFRWQDRALCGSAAEEDKDQFTNSYPVIEVARDLVRRFCHQCPVMNECRTWATGERHFSGVAGGALFSGGRWGERRTIPITRSSEAGNG
jgi:hypothetical protein